MIKSMTGFGQVAKDDSQVQITAEVKSLNSKFLDLNLRLPKIFADREMEVRNLISEKLERGKVAVAVEYQPKADRNVKQSYNHTLFAAYYAELKKLADTVNANHGDLFDLALNSPDVIQSKISDEGNTAEWEKVKACIVEAIGKCEEFRQMEGKVLGKMLIECINVISDAMNKVEELDPKRVARIRERLKGNVVTFLGEEGVDMNRLEQEIIFYIEKLDINEEKVRLRSHLDYFLTVLKDNANNGKKLGFISQEIGREINTIGSKANDAEIQKYVVLMKDELEKIKEQLNNVL
jgi:uncharacterized protein (TIGR00255 family)